MFYIVTIVLDGMPWIGQHLAQFDKLPFDWEWHVVSGVAKPVNCTGWCKEIPPRLPSDGTHEYMLDLHRHHPRVRYHWNEIWPGKCAMFNHALAFMRKPGALMEIDSDELWGVGQLMRIKELFDDFRTLDSMRFACDYRVGPNLRCITRGAYGNNPGEWLRAWRYVPGVNFSRHEPPVYGVSEGNCLNVEATEKEGLEFLHPAYATEKQVEFKEIYYGYVGAVEQWRRLQANTHWPARLGDFLHWVTDGAMVDQVIKTI